MTSTMAVVMSMEDAVAAGGGFREGSGLAADPFWLLCLARSCKCHISECLSNHPHDIDHTCTHQSCLYAAARRGCAWIKAAILGQVRASIHKKRLCIAQAVSLYDMPEHCPQQQGSV